MDTQVALITLKNQSDNLGTSISAQTNLKEAIDLAVLQLQGTLKTQVMDAQAALTDAKQALLDANVAVPDSVAALVPDVETPAA